MQTLIAAERTADRLLMILKTRGAQTTRSLANALEISRSRECSSSSSRLEADGMVESRPGSGGVGRPALSWSLTERALDKFPDTHAELTVTLIESIRRSLGEAALEAVIAERESGFASALSRRSCRSEDVEGAGQAAGGSAHRRGLHGGSRARCRIRVGCSRKTTARSARQREVVRGSAGTNWNCFENCSARRSASSASNTFSAAARRCAYRITPRD